MRMTEDPSRPGVYIVTEGVAGVSGGTQSADWAASGQYSLLVATGDTATIALAESSTVIATARNAGQVLTVGGNPVTSNTTDDQIRTAGATSAVFGPGWWDKLGIVEGEYDGEYFDGGTIGTRTVKNRWDGTRNESTSTRTVTLSPGEELVPAFPGGKQGVARAIGWELTLGGNPVLTPILAEPPTI